MGFRVKVDQEKMKILLFLLKEFKRMNLDFLLAN